MRGRFGRAVRLSYYVIGSAGAKDSRFPAGDGKAAICFSGPPPAIAPREKRPPGTRRGAGIVTAMRQAVTSVCAAS